MFNMVLVAPSGTALAFIIIIIVVIIILILSHSRPITLLDLALTDLNKWVHKMRFRFVHLSIFSLCVCWKHMLKRLPYLCPCMANGLVSERELSQFRFIIHWNGNVCLFNVQFTTGDVHWWAFNMLPCWNRSAFKKKMNGLNGCKWTEKKTEAITNWHICSWRWFIMFDCVSFSISIYIHSSAPIVLVALPVIKWPTNCSVPVQTYARTCTCPIRTKQLEAKSLDSSIDSNEWIEYIYIERPDFHSNN